MAFHQHRLAWNLNELGEEIANKNAGLSNLSFERYLDKVIYKAMQEIDVDDIDLNTPFKVYRKQFRKPVIPNRFDFIQKLAIKYKTTTSSVIELLLTKGLN